jgi:histidine triad (HIT) family protein
MDNCIFCKILANQVPSNIVYHDEHCTAFLDIHPINAGHLLVIPNAHSSFLSGLEPDTGAQMFRVAQRMAQALRSGVVPCDGVNLFLADGKVAGQEVFHVHLHVFPRLAGDNFRMNFGTSQATPPSPTELEGTAERIRGVL